MKAKAIMLALAMVPALFTVPEKESELYPTTGIVTEVDTLNDTVTFTDFNGFEWSFKGIEDYCTGDRVAAIMDDKGTENIFDDEIVKVRYCGWVY